MATIEELEQFDRRGNMPWLWQIQAHQIIAAANVLLERYRQHSTRQSVDGRRQHMAGELQPWTGLMLYGFAIENLAKALLLAQGERATENGRLEKDFRVHALTRLCERADITLSERERELLERIERFTELGRYPICASADRNPNLFLASPEDPQTIMQLLQRLDDTFRAASPASIDEDLVKLGIELVPIDEDTYMARIAMLHGQRIDGSDIETK